jgi:clan AA aspartic protease (TIGR02281 family)
MIVSHNGPVRGSSAEVMKLRLRDAFIWPALIGGTCSCMSYTSHDASSRAVITVKADREGLTGNEGAAWVGFSFHLFATANNATFRFLVDTGSSVMALSKEDAKKAGMDLTSIKFEGSSMTAKGSVGATPVTLDRITIGPCVFTNVQVAVLDVDKAEPLLGMNVLGLMDHVDIHDRTLTMDCNQLPPRPMFGFSGYRLQ